MLLRCRVTPYDLILILILILMPIYFLRHAIRAAMFYYAATPSAIRVLLLTLMLALIRRAALLRARATRRHDASYGLPRCRC